jgi:heptosyltransferase-3
MTQKAPSGENFDRIIVIVTRQIGDVLLTTPVIHAARLRWPNARIDVLGFAGTLGILRGNPDITELIEVKAGSSWRQSIPLIRRLWRQYDLALVAQYTDRAHLYGWVAASTRSGQLPADRRSWWKRVMLRHRVELGDGHSHVLLEKIKLLDPWADPLASQTVQPPPAAPLPADFAERLAPRYVVLQVPSLVHFKQWPIRHQVQLIRELAKQGQQVVLTGGPSEADRALVAEVLGQVGGDGLPADAVLNAAGRLDMNQMVALLRASALYVGPDTSITHLAAACAVPVVALFGPIDPTFWGPWPAGWPPQQPYERSGPRQHRGNVILLQGNQSCVPCNGAGCDKHRDSRSECLETMGPERVLAEAMAILSSKG